MFQQLQAFALTLALLLGGYYAYSFVAVRYLMPPPIAQAAQANGTQKAIVLPQPRRPFAQYFSEGDWEIGTETPVHRLETKQGTLLFQSYQPISKTQLEIVPFTLIVFPQQKEGAPITADAGRPVIIQSPQGARLTFDLGVDLMRGDFASGKMREGRLLGPVHIRGPESAPAANDDFELTTTNVQINEQNIRTRERVHFRYGQNEIVGSDLVIELANAPPKEESPAAGDKKLALAGIETLTLYTFEKGVLYPERPKKPEALGPSDELPEPIVPVEVQCGGSLMYVSSKQMATLERDVILTRENPTGEPDTGTFPKGLDIFFGRDGDTPPDPLESAPNLVDGKPTTPKNPTGQVQRIVGRGSSDNPATVDLPSRDVHAVGDVLEFNVKLQRAFMRMLRSGASVHLRQGTTEFWSNDIRYELPPKGKMLGRLWAAGPGKIRAVTGEGEDVRKVTASWRKELTIWPQEANQLISLVDGAQINFEGTGDFRADTIHLWVLETKKPARRRAKVIGEPQKAQSLLAEGGIVPDRMQALGRVRIESPELNADANKFEAWFVAEPADLPNEPSEPGGPASSGDLPPPQANAGNSVTEPSGSPVLRQPRNPAVAAVDSRVANQAEPAKADRAPKRSIAEPRRRRDPNGPPPQQFQVSCDSIRMQVLQSQGETLVDELIVEGKSVKIRETRVELGVLPLTITGNMIHMQDGATGAARFTIYGGPTGAEVAARGMKLKSPQLHLSQAENRVWSRNPGEMRLLQERDLNGKPLPQPQEIEVKWNDGMTFDGLTAQFRGKITIDGESQHAEAELLKATLTKRIDFADPQLENKDRDPENRDREPNAGPELAAIALIDKVFLESREYDLKGRQKSLERMEMKALTIEQATGDVTGIGPGWVSTVRNDQGNRLGVIPGANLTRPPTATRPDHESVTEETQSLAYLRVDFTDRMRANTQTREASFGEQVEAVYGPVKSWEGKMVAERRESLGDRGLLLYCESLVVRQMPGQHGIPDSVEFEASGNAHIEGQVFTASARRLSFASNKQQLVLEGDGRNDAEIRHHVKGGFFAAEKIIYHHDSGRVETDGVRSLDTGILGGNPGPSQPKPPSPRDFRGRR